MLLLQGWTLSFELYFYFVFFLLLLSVPERIATWLLALWGLTIIALKLRIGLSPFPVVNLLISPSLLEFLAGCILFYLYRRSRLHPSAGILLLITSLLWLTAVVVYTAHLHPDHPQWIVDGPWRRPLLYGTFSVLFLFGAMELERTRIIRYLPLLSSIGDWSYSIYLCHILVLTLISRIALHLLPHPVSILLITLIGLPSVLLVGYLSYTFVERPILSSLYKLTPQSKTPAKQPA
jgi:peptidoglycan/LPS O-acetylase OafA/YrhL